MNKAQFAEAAVFVGKWLAISVIAYFGYGKLGPYIDSIVPF